jgi:hypothetical protein
LEVWIVKTTLGLRPICWLVLGIALGVAQAQKHDEPVLLSIEVTDSKGHYINGLHAKDFRIFEDSIVQKINTFVENENIYEATYYPAQNPNQGFRRIDVEIVAEPDRYRVRTKPGYTPMRPIAKNSK